MYVSFIFGQRFAIASTNTNRGSTVLGAFFAGRNVESLTVLYKINGLVNFPSSALLFKSIKFMIYMLYFECVRSKLVVCRRSRVQIKGSENVMKNWNDKKKELKSIDSNRLNELEAVAQLVNSIHQRRIELGWTQKQLADKVGLHQESIARIENGGTVPRLDTVFKLAQALGMRFSLNGMEEAATVTVV